MKILGIDPGTVSFDLCLLDDDRVTYEDSIPSSVVAERPEELAEKCLRLKVKALIAPSGMGLPNRHFNELSPRDMFELTLVREGEHVPALAGWAEQKSREGACDSCSQFEFCRGCLARTTILLGDPLASDPCCPFSAETL
jgi:MoaA/NifB/PqqE/SkfB family radical SAM enzyme